MCIRDSYEAELKALPEVFPQPYRLREYALKWPLKTLLERVRVKGGVGYELYNLREDPMETVNLAEEEGDVLGELKALLDEWIGERVGEGEDPMLHLERYTQPQPIDYQRL